MTFFSNMQSHVFKTSWIPVLLYFFISQLLNYFPAAWYTPVGYGFGLGLIIAWEFLVTRRYKPALILWLVCTLAVGLQAIPDLDTYVGREDGRRFWLDAYTLVIYILIVTIRFFLSGRKEAVQAGLLAGTLYFLFPRNNSHITAWLLEGAKEGPLSTMLPMITTLLLATYKTISYYVIIFLTQQAYNSRIYIERLFSKVQVMHTWEYIPLFLTTWWVLMAGIAELAHNISAVFEPGYLSLRHSVLFAAVSSLAIILFIYLGAILLRNIIVSRTLTVARHDAWLYILHYIPLLNLVPLVILANANGQNTTVEENVRDYQQPLNSLPGKILILAGILLTSYQLYQLLTEPTGMRLPVITCLAILFLAKIAAYACLTRYKPALLAVVALNVATIVFTLSDFFLLYLAFTYLGYYLLQEIYYPQLEPEDESFISAHQPDI